MNYMRVITHKTDNKIPKGKAALGLDNNGFVGTNNGWPLVGQPALYPESQAYAIATAWNFCVGKVEIDPVRGRVERERISGNTIVPINAYLDGQEKKLSDG